MKLGMLLGFEDSINTITTLAREGEAAGFSSMYTVEAGRSAFVPAAAVINATEEVRVGTYIVNAYARDPWLCGLAARDLDELSGGRFVLGIGTGNPHFNEWYMGADTSKPLAKMRDYLEIVRAVVAGKAGEAVRHSGDVHSIRWRASWDPTRASIPAYLSASGPRMVKLAGEVSDGVGVGIMSSATFLADIVRPNARAAAEAVGREADALAFPMGALVSVNSDEEVARNATKAAICGLFHPVPHPYYDSQLRQLGHTEFADQATELMPAGRTREAMELVPDEVVDTMTITGTPQQCAARLTDYEGLADEVIVFRVAQRDEPKGMAAYEDLFELAASQTSVSNTVGPNTVTPKTETT
ncbi:MAG: 5,10-methylenetetrahydromethanopterin reductase [Acidimicrobiales bacterium]|jgi:5,10-methylenetetrahydromethanopterin reductase